MQFIRKNSDNNYEMTEDQFVEIHDATHNISLLLDIMYDYCEHNSENGKILPLINIIEQLQSEKRKITEKF